MTSTLKIYKSSNISPRKNFIIDSISDYLATLADTLTITNFQFIKHELNLEIKVNLSQTYLNYWNPTAYDYLSIQNESDTTPVYYFIIGKKWRGQDTLLLSLSMDTINTLKYGTDYTLDDKTKINRQHKDRFKKVDVWTKIPKEEDQPRDDEDIYDWITINKWNLLFDQTANDRTGDFGFVMPEQGDTLRVQIYDKSLNKVVGTIGDCCFISLYDGELDTYDDHGTLIERYEYASLYDEYGENIEFLVSLIGEAPFENISYTGDWYKNYDGRLVSTTKIQRVIDFNSEGITPILYGKIESVLLDDGRDWYLVYKGSSPKCFICANTIFDTKIDKGGSIAHGDLTTGRYYYIMPDGAQGQIVTLTDNNGIKVTARLNSNLWAGTDKTIICYWRDGTDIKYKLYYYYNPVGAGYIENGSSETYTCTSFTLTANQVNVLVYWLTTQTQNTATIRTGTQTYITLTSSTYSNASFEDLSRDDADLIKIIKLPYRPYNDTNGMDFDNTMKMLYLDNLNIPFNYDFKSDYNPLKSLLPISSLPTSNMSLLRSKTYESKLYHSDYYQPKFVYDSFSFVFALERVNLDKAIIESKFPITFSVSNTINSRFMFIFSSYVDEGKSVEDYSNILYVARNNEVTILNSDYINYLRLGYNYDVKNRQRQEAGLWTGFGLSVVGSVVSFALTGLTSGVSAAAGISLATSAMAQLVNAVNTTAKAEESQTQKLTQLRQQKAAVYGADDVDLMSKYTSNKAKFMLYKASPLMESVLYDLFFYTGYIDGTMGVPNVTSRFRFNFVSCNPVFKTHSNIPEDILTDIEIKLIAGVTFIHKANNTWDLEQKYENWEISIM